MPTIDKQRQSHVFLLDGARGSGKSSVLVTLLDVWSRRFRGQDIEGYKQIVPWEPGEVVPLTLVDLQPLDPHTNLLLHLVSHIEPVVRFLEDQGLPTQTEAQSWERARELNSRDAWRRLVAAAATGWDGPLAKQASSLRVEEYVDEAEHAARVREHPSLVLQPIDPTEVPAGAPLALSINTDNPLTFATCLADEYVYLHAALKQHGIAAATAASWLDRARLAGWRSRFTLPLSPDLLRRSP